MPRKANPNVILRSYILRRQGSTLDEILDRLSEEFEEDQIPDRSTISRHLKQHQSIPPNELAEDAPFKWSQMNIAPWEGSQTVLGAYAHYVTNGLAGYFGPFTNRLAKWIWRISQALSINSNASSYGSFAYSTYFDFEVSRFGTELNADQLNNLFELQSIPTKMDIISIALEYSWRETHSILFSSEFDTFDLDFWLAFAPWQGPTQLLIYNLNRDATEGVGMLKWHYTDVEWLDDVDPETAASHRKHIPHLLIPPGNVPSEAREDAQKRLRAQMDGLLPSQGRIAVLWFEAAEKNSELWGKSLDQWYLEFYRRYFTAFYLSPESEYSKNCDSILEQMQKEQYERQHQASKQK